MIGWDSDEIIVSQSQSPEMGACMVGSFTKSSLEISKSFTNDHKTQTCILLQNIPIRYAFQLEDSETKPILRWSVKSEIFQ